MMRSSVSLIAVTLGTAGGTLVEHFLLEHQERQFRAKFFVQDGRPPHQRRLLLPTFLGHWAVT
jgi:hypothetical protein